MCETAPCAPVYPKGDSVRLPLFYRPRRPENPSDGAALKPSGSFLTAEEEAVTTFRE